MLTRRAVCVCADGARCNWKAARLTRPAAAVTRPKPARRPSRSRAERAACAPHLLRRAARAVDPARRTGGWFREWRRDRRRRAVLAGLPCPPPPSPMQYRLPAPRVSSLTAFSNTWMDPPLRPLLMDLKIHRHPNRALLRRSRGGSNAATGRRVFRADDAQERRLYNSAIRFRSAERRGGARPARGLVSGRPKGRAASGPVRQSRSGIRVAVKRGSAV